MFDPWSQKIPQALEQQAHVPQLLSPCSRACEPQLLSPCAAPTEACAPQQEKPLLATIRESPRKSNEDPSAAKDEINKYF